MGRGKHQVRTPVHELGYTIAENKGQFKTIRRGGLPVGCEERTRFCFLAEFRGKSMLKFYLALNDSPRFPFYLDEADQKIGPYISTEKGRRQPPLDDQKPNLGGQYTILV